VTLYTNVKGSTVPNELSHTDWDAVTTGSQGPLKLVTVSQRPCNLTTNQAKHHGHTKAERLISDNLKRVSERRSPVGLLSGLYLTR